MASCLGSGRVQGCSVGLASVGTRWCSSGCGGRDPIGVRARVSPMSRDVLDAMQKYEALLHQPICRHDGTTSCVGSSGLSFGRM